MRTINVLQFITPTGFYGAERWILALSNNLNPEKVRSDLVVTTENGRRPEILEHFNADKNQAFDIEMNGRFSLSAIRALVKLIKEREIDIIHTHGYKSDIMGLIAARLAGIKSISTPHGFGEPADIKLKAFIRLGKFALKFCDAVVPLSEQLMGEVREAGIAKKKLYFIRNAVDLKEVEQYRVNKSIKEKTDAKRRIGYIGQMIPRKKIDHILNIYNQMWLENNNIEIQFLGDGSSRHEMEVLANTLPSAESIHFLGFRNDRLALLSQFDLFVMTSSDEGIPRCLMEAIAMEVPVAAYDIPGIDQLVMHNKTGLLAKYGDQETLKKYWTNLLTDEMQAKELAQQGRAFVNERYSGQRMADEYTTLYKDLLTTNRSH
ncbi:MAG: glycosyltransferase [Gammaproteobacteria bacterium]|nr:glycosyltransferase [Gammaproteobacteria bacterium]